MTSDICFIKKSVYIRKYHIENKLFDLQKLGVDISYSNKEKIYKILDLLNDEELNRGRKRLISIFLSDQKNLMVVTRQSLSKNDTDN